LLLLHLGKSAEYRLAGSIVGESNMRIKTNPACMPAFDDLGPEELTALRHYIRKQAAQ